VVNRRAVVGALRVTDGVILSLVAEAEGTVVGRILFSSGTIETAAGKRVQASAARGLLHFAACLAPSSTG
jgi:predicted N-acetyltransferase YhbS